MASFRENRTVVDKILLAGFVLYLGVVFVGATTGVGPAVPAIEWCRSLQSNLGPSFSSGKITLAMAALAGLLPFAFLKLLGRLALPAGSEIRAERS